MISLDEDALICDLAETYSVLEYRSLPLKLVATLSAGLRDDSRIKTKIMGLNCSQDRILLAHIADRIELFRYGFTEDAKTNKNPPSLIVDSLMGRDDKPKERVFDSFDDFQAELERLRGN